MNKVEEIFKSFSIAFDPNEEQAALAAERIKVCNDCEHKDIKIGISRCGMCGCLIKVKIFSPAENSCPAGKWEDIDKQFLNK